MYVCAYAHRSQSSARSPPRRRHAFLHRSDFVSLQSGLKQILEETEEEEAIDIDILPLSKEKKKKKNPRNVFTKEIEEKDEKRCRDLQS